MILDLTVLSYININKKLHSSIPKQILLTCKRKIAINCVKENPYYNLHIKKCDLECVVELFKLSKIAPTKMDLFTAVNSGKLNIVKYLYNFHNIKSYNKDLINAAIIDNDIKMIKFLVKNKLSKITLSTLNQCIYSSHEIFLFLLNAYIENTSLNKVSKKQYNKLILTDLNNISHYDKKSEVFNILIQRGDLVLIQLFMNNYKFELDKRFLITNGEFEIVNYINDRISIDWLHFSNDLMDVKDKRIIILYMNYFDKQPEILSEEYSYLIYEQSYDNCYDLGINKYKLLEQIRLEAVEKNNMKIYKYLCSI